MFALNTTTADTILYRFQHSKNQSHIFTLLNCYELVLVFRDLCFKDYPSVFSASALFHLPKKVHLGVDFTFIPFPIRKKSQDLIKGHSAVKNNNLDFEDPSHFLKALSPLVLMRIVSVIQHGEGR